MTNLIAWQKSGNNNILFQNAATSASTHNFSQDIPPTGLFENRTGPPILPPHLLQVILNKVRPDDGHLNSEHVQKQWQVLGTGLNGKNYGTKYSGDLNTRNIWIPSFLKFGFQIVGLCAMSYVLGPTIWILNQHIKQFHFPLTQLWVANPQKKKRNNNFNPFVRYLSGWA